MFEHVFEFDHTSNEPRVACMESGATKIDHFAFAFVLGKIARRYDVVKMFWRSKVYSCRHYDKRYQFIVLAMFSGDLGLKIR